MTEAGTERDALRVESAGECIYAEVTGTGSPVALCHGLGGNHGIWWRQIEPLARRHRLVTWDQRGFGNSTARTGGVGIGQAAGDLGAVLDALRIRRCHLVGQSMGGFVALRFALDHPDRVASLVLSTTLAGAPAEHTRRLHGLHPPRPRRDRHPVLTERFCAEWPDLAVLYNQLSSFGDKPPVLAMLESMVAATATDAQLSTVRHPVLFLAAEHDEFCPPAVLAASAGRFPAARLEVIPGAAHSAYYEYPDAWNARVLRFLAACDRTDWEGS